MVGRPIQRQTVETLMARGVEFRRANYLFRKFGRAALEHHSVPKPTLGEKMVQPPKRRPGGRQKTTAQDPETGEFTELMSSLQSADLADDEDTHRLFEKLRRQAFQFASDIMDLELNPDHKGFNKLLSVKQAIATATFTATTRVRAGDLRPRDDDGVGKLLARVKAEGQERQDEDADPHAQRDVSQVELVLLDEPTAADLLA